MSKITAVSAQQAAVLHMLSVFCKSGDKSEISGEI